MRKLCIFLFIFSLTTLLSADNLKKPLKTKLSESLFEPTKTEKLTDNEGKNPRDIQIIADEMFPSYENNKSLIDMPLSGGIHSFATIVNEMGGIVVDLCILCCFLCIIFNCFKLWFATTEVKKFFVDIIYKLIICIILLLVYVPFTNSLISLATSLGGSISGGYQKINTVYVNAYASMEAAIEKGLKDITEVMYTNATEDKDGKKYITEEMVEELKSYGMSQERVEEWAKQKGLNIAYPVYEDKLVSQNTGKTEKALKHYKDANGNVLEKKGWIWTHAGNFTSGTKKSSKQNKKLIDEKEQLSLVTKINSLMEVLSGEGITPEDLEKDINEQQQEKKLTSLTTLKNLFYSPYLVNTNKENTAFLSPSKILKTITVMTDAVAYGINSKVNVDTSEMEDKKLNPSGVWTFKGLLNTIIALIYKFGMIVCCVIVMGEYVLTILEFYLVRGLATLLIPFFFLDATKSYAENLIKIFFNYFFKVLITVFICYFSLGLFLDTALLTFNSEQTTFNLVLYLSTLSIGTMFCSKIPNILSTLLSGNPSMGWGNIAETARGAAHGMHMAMNAANSAKRFAGGVVHAGQGVVRGGLGAAATLDSMASAYDSAVGKMQNYNDTREADPKTGMMPAAFTDSQMKSAGISAALSAAGSSMKQSIGDSLYKGLTGQEKRRNIDDGETLNFGQNFEKDGRHQNANFSDMKDAAVSKGQSIGGSRGDSIVENKKQQDMKLIEELRRQEEARKTKNLPDNNQDVYWNK